jgi:hypothetical protein
MRLKPLIAIACIAFPCLCSAQAPAWSGILDPSRAADWTQAGITGGIPARTTVCKTVAPSGLTDTTDTTNIQNAIAACAGKNQVVQLQAGTYTISQGLNFGSVNDVTLRGAGPDKTKLDFTGVLGCNEGADVCLQGSVGWVQNYSGSTTWTGGYSQGTTTITLGTTAGLSVGQLIILDQRDDSIGITSNGASENGATVTITTSLPHGYKAGQIVGVGGVGVSGYNGWYTITAVPTSTTFQYTVSSSGLATSGGGYSTVDTGGVFINDVPSTTIDETGGIGRSCPDSNDPNCAPGEISQRNQMEIKRITAISGNQVTIDPPLEMTNWRGSQAPGVWWVSNYDIQDGIEDLTLDYSNDNCGSRVCGGIVFFNTYECWAKNIRSIDGNRNHVWIEQSARTEVVDSYFFGTKAGAAKSYGVEAYGPDSNNLIQNNICQHVVACLMIGGDWGSVYSYNYAVDSGYSPTDWLIGMIFPNHDFAGMDLFEGNDADAFNYDNVHGTGSSETAFRNRIRGQDIPAKTASLDSIFDNSFNRAENFVGNVLGTASAETSYQTTTWPGGSEPSGYVWVMGTQAEHGSVPYDPLVVQTALRWGNYDAVNGSVQWNASEIPTLAFAFVNGNAVPPGTTLPNSFYLSTAPAFWQTKWGTPPFPAIGPDVTGGTAPDGVGGYSYALPAQLCFENTPTDPAYQQTLTVSGVSWSSGTATLTIGSNALASSNTIIVTGVNPVGYNGVFAVTSATASTVSYALPGNPGVYSSGGTVGHPNILLYNAANCYPSAYVLGPPPNPPTNLNAVAH